MKGSSSAVPECSFCFCYPDAIRTLFPSPEAPPQSYICSDCIAVCNSVLSDEPAPPSGVNPSAHSAVLRCSFCGKIQDAVKKLISSPRAERRSYVCDECVARAIRSAAFDR
jgi:ATP-dependent protease Clp ATPase subunit